VAAFFAFFFVAMFIDLLEPSPLKVLDLGPFTYPAPQIGRAACMTQDIAVYC